MFDEISAYVSKIKFDENYINYFNSFQKFKNIIIIGNGGSNSIASHIAEDSAKFHKKRALSFSDPSMLTCFINDFGMENAYVEFLKIFSNVQTLNIFISSSGMSRNIINAVQYSENNNLPYGILTGFDPNNKVRLKSKNPIFDYHINNNNYGVVECVHQIFLHGVI